VKTHVKSIFTNSTLCSRTEAVATRTRPRFDSTLNEGYRKRVARGRSLLKLPTDCAGVAS